MQEDDEQLRSREEIVASIDELVKTRGFLVAFSELLKKENFYSVKNDTGGNREDILFSEIAFILGRMVMGYDYGVVSDSSVGAKEMKAIQAGIKKLLRELHLTYITGEIPSCMEDLVRGNMATELFFYSESGAYDIQFIEHVRKIYRYDLDWLKRETGYDIEKIEIIYRVLVYRLNFAYHCISEDVAGVTALDIFRISPVEIMIYATVIGFSGITLEDIEKFFEIFGYNKAYQSQYEGFDGIECRNIIVEKPLIKLDDGNYYFASPILLAKAIYEFPYHAIIKLDEMGRLENVGEALEETTYEYLESVFGDENVFRDVEVKKGKNVVTDIDVLVKFGKTLVIVQDKGKRLTMAARAGDDEAIRKDFYASIQKAYEQGLKVAKAISTTPKHKLVLKVGEEAIDLKDGVDRMYLMCINGDYYPGDKMQVATLLKIEDDMPPAQMSIFDLQLATYYIRDPYDFIFYLDRRMKEHARIISESEVNYLAYYLDYDLLIPEDSDVFMIGNDFEWELRKDYCYARLYEENSEYVFPRRRLPYKYVELIKDIENVEAPVDKISVSILMRSVNQETANKVVSLVGRTVRRALIKCDVSDFTLGLKDKNGNFIGGIIYVVGVDYDKLVSVVKMLYVKHAVEGETWVALGYLCKCGVTEIVTIIF